MFYEKSQGGPNPRQSNFNSSTKDENVT